MTCQQAANHLMDVRVQFAEQRPEEPDLLTEYQERYPEDWP